MGDNLRECIIELPKKQSGGGHTFHHIFHHRSRSPGPRLRCAIAENANDQFCLLFRSRRPPAYVLVSVGGGVSTLPLRWQTEPNDPRTFVYFRCPMCPGRAPCTCRPSANTFRTGRGPPTAPCRTSPQGDALIPQVGPISRELGSKQGGWNTIKEVRDAQGSRDLVK